MVAGLLSDRGGDVDDLVLAEHTRRSFGVNPAGLLSDRVGDVDDLVLAEHTRRSFGANPAGQLSDRGGDVIDLVFAERTTVVRCEPCGMPSRSAARTPPQRPTGISRAGCGSPR